MDQPITASIEAASEYARLGMRVIPVEPGTRKPAWRGWPQKATIDLDVIQAWWTKHPDHWVGIACIGFTCIDADAKHGGVEVWKALRSALSLGPTWVDKNPTSGGQHWIYANDTLEFKNLTWWWPGIDIKTVHGDHMAGFVLMPGGDQPV